jgi:hypothetical protein
MSINNDFLETSPQTLYKYRDWSNEYHRNILTQNQIWLSSPKGLNDPFDCQLPMIIDEKEIKSQAFFKFLCKDGESLDIVLAKWKEILLNPKEFFKQWEPELLEMYLNFGVFSLCKSPSNYLLWSHYAKGHKGFCLGFDTKVLVKKDIQGTFEKVSYKLNFPTFKFLEDSSTIFSKALATKHRRWIYEDEWRITKINSADKNIVIGLNTVTEIYFGANMDKNSKHEIIKILKQKGMAIKLYEMVLSQTSFKVEPKEIFKY